MKPFDLVSACRAAVTGCYFYPNKTWCIIVKSKVDDKVVSDLLAKLNNEIPEWLRLGVDRHTRTLIQFQNSTSIRILSSLSQLKGLSIDIAFVDSRLTSESVFEVLAPLLAQRGGNPGDRIISFENI